MNQTRRTEYDLIAALEDRGHRVTEPRRNIVALLDRRSEGISAEEAASELPEVGRATVYRTIRLLLEAGAICKLAMPDGTTRYALSRAAHHHHTLCVRCGTVGEFRDATIERMLRSIGSDISGEIVGHRMEFHIVCQDCIAGVST